MCGWGGGAGMDEDGLVEDWIWIQGRVGGKGETLKCRRL